MAERVRADPGRRRLTGDGWSLRADRVETAGDSGWRALVGVRHGLHLLVIWGDRHDGLEVEAWAAEPEDSDGVAVIDTGDGDLRLARVPLCGCGDRGCGNAGIQLGKWLPDDELPALVELLRDLDWTHVIPTRENVLRGSGLAAIPGPGND
jgi:hypothetical protein